MNTDEDAVVEPAMRLFTTTSVLTCIFLFAAVSTGAAQNAWSELADSFLEAEIENAAKENEDSDHTLDSTTNADSRGTNNQVYVELGLPIPAEPTEARPFFSYEFDSEMLAKHPEFSPLHLQAFEYDKVLVYNFIDHSPEGKRFSDMQTQVLDQTLNAIAPISEAKDLMLVNVVTNAENGDPVYGAAFLALYEGENGLGPEGTPLDNVILPYGIVYGEAFREDGTHRLFDFSLLNGVRTNADLNANAEAIAASLHSLILNYNKRYEEESAESPN